MKGLPWHKRYHGDFLNGVHGIGPDVIGCYAVILDMIYERGGPIPDDPRLVGAWLGCSMRKAKGLMQRLLELGKLIRTPSGLSNMRAETELAKLCHLRDSAQKSGSKGGRLRAERAKKPFVFNETGQGSLKAASSIARGLPDKIDNFLPVQSTTQGEKESGSAEKQAEVAAPPASPSGKEDTISISSYLLSTKLMKRRA